MAWAWTNTASIYEDKFSNEPRTMFVVETRKHSTHPCHGRRRCPMRILIIEQCSRTVPIAVGGRTIVSNRPSPPHRNTWHPGLPHVPALCPAGSRECPFSTGCISVVGLGNYFEAGTGSRSDFPPTRKPSRPPRVLVTTITVGADPHASARCRSGSRSVPGSFPIPKGGTS